MNVRVSNAPAARTCDHRAWTAARARDSGSPIPFAMPGALWLAHDLTEGDAAFQRRSPRALMSVGISGTCGRALTTGAREVVRGLAVVSAASATGGPRAKDTKSVNAASRCLRMRHSRIVARQPCCGARGPRRGLVRDGLWGLTSNATTEEAP